jgi:Ca2+-binding EF-hand superfamily protein
LASAGETADATPVSKERILLLTPGSPLVIEFQLTIDGRPHTAALENLVDEVMKLADADGDGRATWKELCECKRIKYGQYGNLPIEGENGEKQIIERYDIDRDRVVDNTELPRFLTRNAGGARPFSVRGTADYRDINRRGAATWRILDTDEDGALSPAEQAAAARRLATRDTDDDEILLATDLNPQVALFETERMNERQRRGPDAVRLLGPHADWGSVQLALEQAYGGNHALRPDSFPLTPSLFGQLDTNQDGRIGRNEFKSLNDVPAHLTVAVEFGTKGDEGHETGDGEQESGVRGQESGAGSQQPRLRLVAVAPELARSGQSLAEQPGRLSISIGGMELTIYTNDTVLSDDFAARAQQALAMFDGNKDGYLEKSEVPESLQNQLGRFEAVDADEDGKAYPAEIEAFLRQQQAGLRAQIHARASDRDDVLFAALDANHDDSLDSREVEAAQQRLKTLDGDADGQVTPNELPEAMVIGLARGSLEALENTFRVPAVVRATDESAPRWFTAMDANSDGAISRREFVGTAEKFGELDRDGNGLLDLPEAR